MTIGELRNLIATTKGTDAGSVRLVAEARMMMQNNYAIPVACCVLALVALALGVSNRKDGMLASFAIGFIVVFAYYVLLYMARAAAVGGKLGMAKGTVKADGVIASASAGTPGGRGTDIFEPLARAPERIANLRGVVLASDGDWNEGPPPVQAAARLRIKGVPVLAVPVGSRTRLPDVELLSLDVPTFGIAGKSVRVPFTVDSSLPRDYITTVTLKTSDGDQVTKEVRIAAMGRSSDWLLWKPKAMGDYTVTLTIPEPITTGVPGSRWASSTSRIAPTCQVRVLEAGL